MFVSYAHIESLRFQMFVVAFRQSTHSSGLCRDVAHVEVRVTWTYTVRIAVIKEITLCLQQTFSSLHSSIDVHFSVSDDKLGYVSRRLEQHLASSTLLYSPVIVA